MSNYREENRPADFQYLEDDTELVRSFAAGNKKAFDQLVMRHKDRIFNLCYWYLGDYQDADDMSQDIFIKVYNKMNTFRFESAFSTWLYRIAVNTCKNRLKSLQFKLRRLQLGLSNGRTGESNDSTIAITAFEPCPAVSLERKEDLTIIQRAIGSLERDKRVIVILRDIEGLSYKEISSATGLKIGTVKSKLARARSELKEIVINNRSRFK